jgi:hypothetical protein
MSVVTRRNVTTGNQCMAVSTSDPRAGTGGWSGWTDRYGLIV